MFANFDVNCLVKKTVNTQLIDIEVENEISLVGDLSDDFKLVDYASLIAINKLGFSEKQTLIDLLRTIKTPMQPLGHAQEYRLGEQITLSLDFTQLDAAFDYRLNKCWATDSSDNHMYILGDEECIKHRPNSSFDLTFFDTVKDRFDKKWMLLT